MIETDFIRAGGKEACSWVMMDEVASFRSTHAQRGRSHRRVHSLLSACGYPPGKKNRENIDHGATLLVSTRYGVVLAGRWDLRRRRSEEWAITVLDISREQPNARAYDSTIPARHSTMFLAEHTRRRQ
jgi:hypothetical protein